MDSRLEICATFHLVFNCIPGDVPTSG